MRKLTYFLTLILLSLNLNAQEMSKPYVELEGKFYPINGLIDTIENKEFITKLVIIEQNKKSELQFQNTELNRIFLTYIKQDDQINLKIVNGEKQIAIFRKFNGSVIVKIFFIKQ